MRQYRFKSEKVYRRRRTVTALLLVTILILAGIYVYTKVLSNPQDNTTPPEQTTENPDVTQEPTNTPETPTPTPTPEPPKGTETKDHGFLPAIGSVEKSGKMDEIRAKVEEFISRQKGKYGVYFIDLATGESFGINDRDSYIAASTSKLPMNLLLYTKIESGEIDPNAKLKYLKEDFEPGTGIIQNQPFGTEYTVRETSRLSIVYSDNCGINMIIRILGIENICQYILDLGGDIYYDDGHRTSPHDLGLVTQELYRLYLNNPDLYGQLINDLENTVFNDRLAVLTSEGVKVAHKIGNQVRNVNDVGIVFASHPFVLAVMTDNVDVGTATNKIGEIAKLIYNEVEAYAGK
ncbi:MAG: serine hydrolase [Clostridiaceae bacterium]|nr:serine hydrolase [Clostridiaceae bacterium]